MRSRSVCSSLSSWNQCVSIPMVLMAGVQDIFRGAFMMSKVCDSERKARLMVRMLWKRSYRLGRDGKRL